MRAGLLTSVLLISACAPGFVAVRETAVEAPVAPGQGPWRLHAALDPRWPHRVSVRLTARCAPAYRVELATRGGARSETVGVTHSAWQQLLREHFLGAPPPRPAARTPGPAPGVGVEVAAAGTAQANAAAGSATAVATVTLPGRWEREITADERFAAQVGRACAQPGTWLVTFRDPIDPGADAVDVTVWSEVPQLPEDGALALVVDVLQPPPEPARPAAPTPDARWVTGRWDWHHEGELDFGWTWSPGRYEAGGPPPPARAETPGAPPHPGQVWTTGSWSWSGDAGWRWTDGHWTVPASPPGAPPPPKDERPGLHWCRAEVWTPGAWRWSDEGWSWLAGTWAKRVEPDSPRPAPRDEPRGEPGTRGATWVTRGWRWDGCDGWTWQAGSWEVLATPSGPPPPPREERPSATACRAERWVSGEWRWTRSGWDWQGGHWQGSATPTTAAPPPRDEAQGRPVVEGSTWSAGQWRWDACAGWAWSGARGSCPRRRPVRRRRCVRSAPASRSAGARGGRWDTGAGATTAGPGRPGTG